MNGASGRGEEAAPAAPSPAGSWQSAIRAEAVLPEVYSSDMRPPPARPPPPAPPPLHLLCPITRHGWGVSLSTRNLRPRDWSLGGHVTRAAQGEACPGLLLPQAKDRGLEGPGREAVSSPGP